MIGTGTKNDLNRSLGGYENITEHHDIQTPNWQMLRSLDKEVQQGEAFGDWVDCLIVAMNFMQLQTM